MTIMGPGSPTEQFIREQMKKQKKSKQPEGCLKELKRLKRHYKKEFQRNMNPFDLGIVEGLSLAIDVLEDKEFYGD